MIFHDRLISFSIDYNVNLNVHRLLGVNHTQLNKPLGYKLDLDGVTTYIEDDKQNKYGIYDKDTGKITMFNSNDGRVVYGLQEIESLSLIDDGVCMVALSNGSFHDHTRLIPIDESVNPYEILDYSRKDLNNTINVLKHQYPSWKEYLYFDEVDNRVWINPMMYGGIDSLKPYVGDETDLLQIMDQCCQLTNTIIENKRSRTIRFNPKKETMDDAIKKMAWDNKRNSFLYEIHKVRWDGKPRIDTFLYDVGCRCPDTIEKEYAQELYLRFVGRAIFLIAIDRSINKTIRSIPFMPVLIGEQGSGKSDLCKWLGMDWYRGTITEMTNEKTFYESSNGSIILELTEGTQFYNTSIEIMKAFVEKDRIQFRGSYEKRETTIPIKFVMVATTNDEKPLIDGSGNRRFYPIRKTRNVVEKQIEDYTREEILQLWAEALVLYEKGIRWDDDLLDETMQDIFRSVQETATLLPSPFDEIQIYLNSEYPNVGDRISNTQLREYLSNLGWYGKDADKILTKLSKHYCAGFGFKSINATYIDGVLSRGYERIERR